MTPSLRAGTIRDPNVGIEFGFFSKRLKKFGLCCKLDLIDLISVLCQILMEVFLYCLSFASTRRLSAGYVRNAPKTSRIP